MLFEGGGISMCRLNNHPVSEIYSPCMDCPLYLETCAPVIFEGFTVGAECDFSLCEYCPYTDCGGNMSMY